MSAFMITSMPKRSLKARLTASPSSRSWNIVAIDATPSPRRSMNSLHRFGPSSGWSSSKFSEPDVDLGATQRVVDLLAAQLGRVVDRRHVVEHLPRRPAERAVVERHRRVQVADREGDLGDGVLEAGEARRQLGVGRHRDAPCSRRMGRLGWLPASSDGGLSSVHGEDAADGIRRLVRGQEQHHVGDLLRSADAPDGDRLLPLRELRPCPP